MSNLLKQGAKPRSYFSKAGIRYGYNRCPACDGYKVDSAAACLKCIRKGVASAHKRRMPRHIAVQPSDARLRTIPLTRGYETTVSVERYEFLFTYNWHASIRRKRSGSIKVYAATRRLDGKEGILLMQNLLMPPPPGMIVDHINGDSLDNRMENLRFATPIQNAQNSRRRAPRSGYRGVAITPVGRYVAQIKVSGRYLYLGTFDTAVEAARVYDAAARIHHGEFAVLNFPRE